MCLFGNCSSFNDCIMVLPKLIFVLLCAPIPSPFPRKWWFAERALWLWCKTWVSAEQPGVLLATQAWNLHHSVCRKLNNRFMGKLFPLLLCFTTNKDEIHEERLNANDCFNVSWTNNYNFCFFMSAAMKQRFSNSSCMGK